jgi:hypothetical protein
VSILIFFFAVIREGCEQVVVVFLDIGILVVIGFSTRQLWKESSFDCLIGFVEYLNFVGGDLVNLERKRWGELL